MTIHITWAGILECVGGAVILWGAVYILVGLFVLFVSRK